MYTIGKFIFAANFKIMYLSKSIATACVAAALVLASCKRSEAPDEPSSKANPAECITDPAKLSMLHSLDDLNGDGSLLEMHYTADYKLQEVIDAGARNAMELVTVVALKLYDKMPSKGFSLSYDAGCSAFAVSESGSESFLMGRNFDYRHRHKDGSNALISAIVVHTSPKKDPDGKYEAYKSVSVVDSYWINFEKGFYGDGETDISALVAAPYLLMDGMNEKGFAVGVLKLDGKPTMQSDAGKISISTTVAMRMLLDRVATVDDAIKMLEEYNMSMDFVTADASFHYFMADAGGNYAILEYVDPTDGHPGNPYKMEVLGGNDTLRCVTNFYVSDTMLDSEYGGKSEHGRLRYNIMRGRLAEKNYSLTSAEAMELLQEVAAGPDSQHNTSNTQWSSLYDLTSKSLKLAILRDYSNVKEFSVK